LAEVLYVFGDDIIVYYDFDESRWFILDTTTSKQSEYKNVPFSALADLFNENKDPLLKKRLAELEKKNPEEAKNIREKNSALEEILIKLAKQYE
jgi:flagellar motor switch protein FliG